MESTAEIAQIENAPAGDKIITFKAVFGKQQGKLKIYPAKDPLTGRLKGVKLLSPNEKLTAKYIVTEETSLIIEDGFTMNPENEKDAIDLEWVVFVPAIAKSFHDSQMSEEALFYIQDEEKEITQRLSKDKLIFDAMQLIYTEASRSRWYDYARLLGNRMDGMKPIAVEEYLMSVAKTEPEKLITTIQDKLAKTRLFFLSLKDRELIDYRDGIWYYGEITLGASEDHVIDYLRNPAHQEIIDLMRQDLAPNTVESAVKSRSATGKLKAAQS